MNWIFECTLLNAVGEETKTANVTMIVPLRLSANRWNEIIQKACEALQVDRDSAYDKDPYGDNWGCYLDFPDGSSIRVDRKEA
jgi:hypothetical protein